MSDAEVWFEKRLEESEVRAFWQAEQHEQRRRQTLRGIATTLAVVGIFVACGLVFAHIVAVIY